MKYTKKQFRTRMTAYLNEHWSEIKAERDVATVMGYSERYFNMRFKEVFGCSFMLYLKQYKLHRAAISIVENKKLTNIGKTVGYANPQSFSKAFRKEFGLSPKQFLESNADVPDMPVCCKINGEDITVEYAWVEKTILQGKLVKPIDEHTSPVREIFVNIENAASTDGAIDLIYDETDVERGTISLGIGIIDPESASLANGREVKWTSSDRSVVRVKNATAVYQSDAEIPGGTTIVATGAGEATLTAQMEDLVTEIKVHVHPINVGGILLQTAEGTKEVTALASDLAKEYGWTLDDNAKEYVTALHVLAAITEDPANNIVVTDGIVSSVNGEEGNWYYILNGEFMGAIDASMEVKAGDEVTYVKADIANGIAKIGMFGNSNSACNRYRGSIRDLCGNRKKRSAYTKRTSGKCKQQSGNLCIQDTIHRGSRRKR